MAKRKIPKIPLGFSPTQATASGAGVHEKTGKKRRRDQRRKQKIADKQAEYD
jgi:hypothetical protein